MMKRMLHALAVLAVLVPAAAHAWEDREDTTIYMAVFNHEWQYSIWPADRELPLGWQSAEYTGLKPAVLEFIERVWTDMRPLSLRKKMLEQMGGMDACVAADLPPHKCQP
ncbi:MbtH family NRPS accessory protein [Novispirillum sp. DQ9]|uniref:MbtH family protein n=1 Tax=Novispirillum sp. DQ9 TaxID=3398612 RepID=UPI003C7D0B5F